MFGLQKHGPDGRYGVVMDVGSASVTMAIVSSDPTQPLPTVVWSYKDRLSIDSTGHLTSVANNITAATVNAALALGSEGVTTLREYDQHAKITDIEVTVCAPWSYTIARTISTKSEEPFEVSKSHIKEMISSAEKQSLEVLHENELFTKLGLEVVSATTVAINANGYCVADPVGQIVQELTLSRLLGVVQKQLENTITESFDKVLPRTTLNIHTFMSQFATVVHALDEYSTELCLVDIGGEATEIGIVRNGVLHYVTHQAYGHNTIVRDIAEITNAPYEEILQACKGDFELFVESLGKEKRDKVAEALLRFTQATAELFTRTGDALSIPKTLFVHCDTGFDDFFVTRLEAASTLSTNMQHNVESITNKIFTETAGSEMETKILLSCYVFHKKLAKTRLAAN